MLKERHRYRAPISTPRRRSNIVPLENVGIIPGNRFILLPLKKVSTIVHRHRCCRSSATNTKTCIVQKARMVSQPVLFQPTASVSAGEINKSALLRPGVKKSVRRLKRTRHPAVVKTCLSPVSEQDQEGSHFIVDQGNHWRQPVDSSIDVGQLESCKRVEIERLLKEADSRQSPSSKLGHRQGEEISSLGHEENGPRLDVVSKTKSYDSSGKRATTLSQELEKEKERDFQGLELGDLQREIHTRIRQFSGKLRQDSALDQLKNQRFKRLVDELQKRIAEARISAERDSAIIPGNHAALKQETTTLRGAQHQRRSNKRLRKVVLKIHTFGRNRVSPSSGSVGHKAFHQVRSVGQQRFVLPPPMPENPANGKSGRVGSWNADYHGVSYADVQSKQKFLKGLICSCTSIDDLPIGPLHTLEEELLNQ